MSSKTQVIFFLLAAAAAAALAVSAQQLPPFPLLPPGVFPPGSSPVDVAKCWSSLVNVQGCVMEIYQAVFTMQFGTVGRACCKAYLAIDASCWPKMFPFNPFFPPLLKDSCSHMTGGGSPPPVLK